MHCIDLELLLILLQQSDSRLGIDQNLQRHRAVSLRQHGFLGIIISAFPVSKLDTDRPSS